LRGAFTRPEARPDTRLIAIRLNVDDISTATRLAEKVGLPYQTYIKSVLHQALEREAKKAGD
jgi:predicted DNA binding CopG/RHH family protein